MWPAARDRRIWSETDRPGERLTVARPLPQVEVVSVRGSNRHWREAHDSLTLGVIHSNQGGLIAQWRTRGRQLSTGDGELMAIEPGEVHVTERLTLQCGVADFDVIRFAPQLVADVAREFERSGEFHFKTPTSNDRPTFSALGGFVNAVAEADDPLGIVCACARALHSVVLRLGEPARSVVPALDPVRDYRLRRVRDYLRAHLHERPKLSELEGVAGLSQWRLCVVFNDAYGVSIGQYWNALRLAEAVRRLQAGASLKMLIAELGYSDEPYFWRVFKAHYGLSPGKWLALYRANDRVSA